jgi:MscS family membrane protein
LAWSWVAQAGPPRDCANPRHAVETVFAWQQDETFDIAAATMCLDGTGRSEEELEQIAAMIKKVFDERALYVRMETISMDSGWRDPASSDHVWVIDRSLPKVFVIRQPDGTWKWPPEALDAIAELHQNRLVEGLVSRMPSWLRGKVFTVELWQYLTLALVFVSGLIVRTLLQVLVRSRLQAMSATLVMGLMLWATYPQLALPIRAAMIVAVAVRIFIITSVVWAFYGLVDVLTAQMAEKASQTDTKLDDQLVPLLRKSMKVVVVLAGVLFGLQNLDIDVGSLLAGLGIGGIAFALAAKDTVSNFFGSVMIFVDRPFQIGDWIAVDGAEGVVEEVGFRTTRVRAFDDALLIVPNARFTEQRITNFGMRRYRRCKLTLGVTYATTSEQLDAFCEGIRAIIRAHPATRKEVFEVWFNNYGAFSLDVLVYFFFKVGSWSEELKARHEVLIEIQRLAAALEVDFAFPTQTLHVESVRVGKVVSPEATAMSGASMERVVDTFGPGREGAPRPVTDSHRHLAGSEQRGGDGGG